MPENTPLALLVGHCGPDAFALRSAVRSAAREATVEMVNDGDSLRSKLPEANLLLVNRVLDGRFETESGIDLIRALAEDGSHNADLRLVSNLPDAQKEAEAVGALPGFGKQDMYDQRTRDLIGESLDASRTA